MSVSSLVDRDGLDVKVDGVKYGQFIQLDGLKLSGTVSVIGTAVTGTNTAFMSELVTGSEITIDGQTFTVGGISSNTSLTVDHAPNGTLDNKEATRGHISVKRVDMELLHVTPGIFKMPSLQQTPVYGSKVTCANTDGLLQWSDDIPLRTSLDNLQNSNNFTRDAANLKSYFESYFNNSTNRDAKVAGSVIFDYFDSATDSKTGGSSHQLRLDVAANELGDFLPNVAGVFKTETHTANKTKGEFYAETGEIYTGSYRKSNSTFYGWRNMVRSHRLYERRSGSEANAQITIDLPPHSAGTYRILFRKGTSHNNTISISGTFVVMDDKVSFEPCNRILKGAAGHLIVLNQTGTNYINNGVDMTHSPTADSGLVSSTGAELLEDFDLYDYMLTEIGTFHRFFFQPNNVVALVTPNFISTSTNNRYFQWGSSKNIVNGHLRTILAIDGEVLAPHDLVFDYKFTGPRPLAYNIP